MAAFNKQFSVLDPFNFPKRAEFFGWPYQIAVESAALLKGRDVAWLNAVGRHLEIVISQQANLANLPQDGPKQARAVENRQILRSKFLARDFYGDVHLFANAEASQDWSQPPFDTERWERYAVLSLWKVVDSYLALAGEEVNKDLAPISRETMRLTWAGGYAVEAMRALQIAQITRSEKESTSMRMSNAAKARHTMNRPSNEELLKLAYDRPFERIYDAAAHVSKKIVKTREKNERGEAIVTRYTPRTVRGWLEDAGWRPNV